jgi:biopolymer transport protein ExbD
MPLKTQHDEAPALNLTSMIDVLFLLIIFFMVATKFDELERNIDVAVPEVSQAGEDNAPPEPIIVTVQADGSIAIGSEVVTIEQLVARLAAARTVAAATDPAVVIRGDAECPFQHIAAALAACRQAGISELGITVRVAGVGGTTR